MREFILLPHIHHNWYSERFPEVLGHQIHPITNGEQCLIKHQVNMSSVNIAQLFLYIICADYFSCWLSRLCNVGLFSTPVILVECLLEPIYRLTLISGTLLLGTIKWLKIAHMEVVQDTQCISYTFMLGAFTVFQHQHRKTVSACWSFSSR